MLDDPPATEPSELPATEDRPDPTVKTLPPGVAEAMLAELAASTAAERPGARGPLAGTSRGVRSAIGCGAALILIAVLIGLVTLVGLLL